MIITQQELNDKIELHQQWLAGRTEGKQLWLQERVLRGVDLFTRTDAEQPSGLDLRRAFMRNADLRGANLQHADLRGADLQHADLRGADLQHADLRGADLRSAKLCGADMLKADLRGAELNAYVDLTDADVTGVDLRGLGMIFEGVNIFDVARSPTGTVE